MTSPIECLNCLSYPQSFEELNEKWIRVQKDNYEAARKIFSNRCFSSKVTNRCRLGAWYCCTVPRLNGQKWIPKVAEHRCVAEIVISEKSSRACIAELEACRDKIQEYEVIVQELSVPKLLTGLRFRVEDILKDNAKMKFFFGYVDTESKFRKFYQSCIPVETVGPFGYRIVNSFEEFGQPVGRKKNAKSCQLNGLNQLALCLMRWRKGIDFHFLAYLFDIDAGVSYRYFLTWLRLIYLRSVRLKSIRMLSRAEQTPFLPTDYVEYCREKGHSEPLRTDVVDDSYLYIQKSRNAEVQSQTWCENKEANLLKWNANCTVYGKVQDIGTQLFLGRGMFYYIRSL